MRDAMTENKGESMEHFMGEGWQLRPAGGATGEAYIAEQGQQKIFIKRNSSPFLAVLSAEGIVPKLLWTKRLENGDVITAQQWIDGRELHAAEMNQDRVAALLATIHDSEELLDMFKRMGNRPLDPEAILHAHAEERAEHHTAVDRALELLKQVPEIPSEEFVVCHSDVHHNNWIEDDQAGLFLIDWDGAQVADPALDLAPLLYGYVPKDYWAQWMEAYGRSLTTSLRYRLWWYRTVQCLDHVRWHALCGSREEEDFWLARTAELVEEAGRFSSE